MAFYRKGRRRDRNRANIFWTACLLAFFLLAGICPLPIWASSQDMELEEENGILERLLEDTELEEIQSSLDKLMGEESFQLREALEKIIRGQQPVSREVILDVVYQAFFGSYERQRGVILQIVLLILAGALFANFAKAFEKGQIGEISFYVVYLILFVVLLSAFGRLSSELGENLDTIVLLMKGLAPAYYLATAASTGVSTAAFFYQIILVIILGTEILTAHLILPCINLYVLLELVNHLSKEELLSRLADLIRMVVEWALKTMLGILVGLQIIQSLVAPVMDTLRRSAIGKTASAIPGVGNAINSVTEIILTSAVLIRNSLGVVFLIALLLWGVTPLLNYGVNALMYKLLAAVAQPVSDKRMVGCINIIGEGCVLLMKTFFTVEILCMIAIVVVASS